MGYTIYQVVCARWKHGATGVFPARLLDFVDSSERRLWPSLGFRPLCYIPNTRPSDAIWAENQALHYSCLSYSRSAIIGSLFRRTPESPIAAFCSEYQVKRCVSFGAMHQDKFSESVRLGLLNREKKTWAILSGLHSTRMNLGLRRRVPLLANESANLLFRNRIIKSWDADSEFILSVWFPGYTVKSL